MVIALATLFPFLIISLFMGVVFRRDWKNVRFYRGLPGIVLFVDVSKQIMDPLKLATDIIEQLHFSRLGMLKTKVANVGETVSHVLRNPDGTVIAEVLPSGNREVVYFKSFMGDNAIVMTCYPMRGRPILQASYDKSYLTGSLDSVYREHMKRVETFQQTFTPLYAIKSMPEFIKQEEIHNSLYTRLHLWETVVAGIIRMGFIFGFWICAPMLIFLRYITELAPSNYLERIESVLFFTLPVFITGIILTMLVQSWLSRKIVG